MHDDRLSAIELDVSAGRERAPAAPRRDTPFRIALVGDFSGRGSRGSVEDAAALVNRGARRIDRDDLDDAIAALAPTIDVRPGDAPALRLRFASLEDFHPEQLADRIPAIRALREMRKRLANPATFAVAARELGTLAPENPASQAPQQPVAGEPDLLSRMLDAQEESERSPLEVAHGDLSRFISRAIAPHVIPRADKRQAEMVSAADAAIADKLRAVLHDPDFQALEALWRAADFLVRRIDTSTELQLAIIDLTAAELAASLGSDGSSASLSTILANASGGDDIGFAAVALGFTFGGSPDDVDLLSRIASFARRARTPWLTAAAPSLVGVPSRSALAELGSWRAPSAEWQSLRRSADARFLGVALPRFLLRSPYGALAEPVDAFPFEEMPSGPSHADYLWGNPAFACVLLLAESFAEHGWAFGGRAGLDIAGLPLHLVRRDGAVTALPCAEVAMQERAAAELLERGVMPLVSPVGSDALRLVRWQSAADPIAALAGPWSADSRAHD